MDKKEILQKIDAVYAEVGINLLYPPYKDYVVARNEQSAKDLKTGGGIHPTDIDEFINISKRFEVKSIFIIGNAYGFSTFVLAEIFKGAMIDAIDADTEGGDSVLGSDITRKIASKYYPNIHLTKGFSPEDIQKAMRPEAKTYDFVLIDGLHTNSQIFKDFMGMLPYLSRSCVVYCHDVGYFNLYKGFDAVAKEAKRNGFDLFCPVLRRTVLGSGVIARGMPLLKEYINGQAMRPVELFFLRSRKILRKVISKLGRIVHESFGHRL